MKDTIIVQFKTRDSGVDYDWLIKLEDALIQAFAQNKKAKVDGHDFGNGNMNIFVIPKGSWQNAFEILRAHLKHHDALNSSVIVLRRKSGAYQVLFPKNYTGDFEQL